MSVTTSLTASIPVKASLLHYDRWPLFQKEDLTAECLETPLNGKRVVRKSLMSKVRVSDRTGLHGSSISRRVKKPKYAVMIILSPIFCRPHVVTGVD